MRLERKDWLVWFLHGVWMGLIGAMAALATLTFLRHAHAHDKWATGEQVPSWIKSACCGQADAHVLGPDEYWIDAHGFHVVGIDDTVPLDKVLPSQDGKVWAFYTVRSKNAVIHCVFYSGSI